MQRMARSGYPTRLVPGSRTRSNESRAPGGPGPTQRPLALVQRPAAQDGQGRERRAKCRRPLERGVELDPIVEATRMRAVAEGSLDRVETLHGIEEVIRVLYGL